MGPDSISLGDISNLEGIDLLVGTVLVVVPNSLVDISILVVGIDRQVDIDLEVVPSSLVDINSQQLELVVKVGSSLMLELNSLVAFSIGA